MTLECDWQRGEGENYYLFFFFFWFWLSLLHKDYFHYQLMCSRQCRVYFIFTSSTVCSCPFQSFSLCEWLWIFVCIMTAVSSSSSTAKSQSPPRKCKKKKKWFSVNFVIYDDRIHSSNRVEWNSESESETDRWREIAMASFFFCFNKNLLWKTLMCVFSINNTISSDFKCTDEFVFAFDCCCAWMEY